MALVPTVITPALLAWVGRNAGIMEQADTDTSRFEAPRLNGVLSDAEHIPIRVSHPAR
ncbi:hypothetical protein FHW79_005431 [Azospirillum sp. OGB3]|uniref:hypothetical protein n=1 Tax=Azospirillum sp. OGB3 TaxID=2587012 RepID=UPI0016065C12|nr:hypothetical protein [Azospirillum sp. OGB3]MBB3267766.1 hypothetical protein [Azospirillum sp. OGB3]